MKNDDKTEKTESAGAPDTERREALIKIGKYAAYTAPAMMVTVATAQAGFPAVPVPPAPISTPVP